MQRFFSLAPITQAAGVGRDVLLSSLSVRGGETGSTYEPLLHQGSCGCSLINRARHREESSHSLPNGEGPPHGLGRFWGFYLIRLTCSTCRDLLVDWFNLTVLPPPGSK